MNKPDYCIGFHRKTYDLKVICPRCKTRELPIGYPGAISRYDNQTELCSQCGTEEGVEQWLQSVKK